MNQVLFVETFTVNRQKSWNLNPVLIPHLSHTASKISQRKHRQPQWSPAQRDPSVLCALYSPTPKTVLHSGAHTLKISPQPGDHLELSLSFAVRMDPSLVTKALFPPTTRTAPTGMVSSPPHSWLQAEAAQSAVTINHKYFSYLLSSDSLSVSQVKLTYFPCLNF